MDASALLAKGFLEMRCGLIDLAAWVDRIERAPGSDGLRDDPRLRQLLEAACLLTDDRPNRTERMQMLFSDPYEADWRDT